MIFRSILAKIFLVAVSITAGQASADGHVERGEYLADVLVCVECHTPGVLSGGERGPDLAGSEVGYEIPFQGIYHGPNLTPDMETGIGSWSDDDIVKAIRTGERPDGRILSAAMPWRAFSHLTDEDAYALAAYLKSLEPVSNQVPGPFGPTETHPGMYYKFMFPGRED